MVLPAPLSPSTTTRLPPVDGEVDVGEDLQRAVGLRQAGRRSAASCRRAPASGKRSLRDLVAARVPPPARPSSRSARRAMLCAALALVALARILSACAMQRVGLLLGVGPLALAAALVGLALLQVGLPADVVDVERGPVGVQVEHLVDDGLEQLDVVADDDQPAAVAREEVAQPDDRVGVEVVRRLVEQQRLRRPRTGSGPARRGGAGRRRACRAAGRAPASGRPTLAAMAPPRTRRRTRRRR